MLSSPTNAPELMAPAGNWDCARAAVENGADAIYFGMQGGFNARARATNFTAAELPELMTYLRTRGVRGYLTLNTLVFSDELEAAEQTARIAIEAGIDAVLVQDLGLLRLLARLCPELPLHASTQMTLSSGECIRALSATAGSPGSAETTGRQAARATHDLEHSGATGCVPASASIESLESINVRRVVLPRELSVAEITAIRQQTSVELEAFVHGALCISYSGQCQASLAMGGRSANRGQCAQPCRLPYQVICDGRLLDTGTNQYPLSPHDLCGHDRIAQLIAAGVSALKIEGRLKPPEYVASVTRRYRAAIDAAVAGNQTAMQQEAIDELESTFSRGFCQGWLDGNDHRSLVSGSASAKRGVYLGEVVVVHGERVAVQLADTVRRGDGIVFEADRSRGEEVGGRVFEIFQGRTSLKEAPAGQHVDLAFRHGAIDYTRVHQGQKVFKTDDPQLEKRLRRSFEGRARRMVLDISVEAEAGRKMHVAATTASRVSCRLESDDPLAEAQKHPLTAEVLREQFGRLGNSPYQLRDLAATIVGRPMAPLSVLGKLRRELLEQLEKASSQPPQRTMLSASPLVQLRGEIRAQDFSAEQPSMEKQQPTLHVLCRSLEQLAAALDSGVKNVIADFADAGDCKSAVALVRRRFAEIQLATPRIHKPGENEAFEFLAACQPDGVLARNLAALAFCRQRGLPAVADFSLNAVNELTVDWLLSQGALRVTAAYDLDPQRLLALARTVKPQSLEVVVHWHPELFHTAYCLFCAHLSKGKNRETCGRPCLKHSMKLRDRYGVEHVLLTDSQCRNRLFHRDAEQLLKQMADLRQTGVRHFRIELLDERSPEAILRVIASVQQRLGDCS